MHHDLFLFFQWFIDFLSVFLKYKIEIKFLSSWKVLLIFGQ